MSDRPGPPRAHRRAALLRWIGLALVLAAALWLAVHLR